jgi:hypothetical protein
MDDSPPTDATRGLLISKLNWWTSDDDIISAVSQAGTVDDLNLTSIAFLEAKNNGKSRGECFILFNTIEKAWITKKYIENNDIAGLRATVEYSPAVTNPFLATQVQRAFKPSNRSVSDINSQQATSTRNRPYVYSNSGRLREGTDLKTTRYEIVLVILEIENEKDRARGTVLGAGNDRIQAETGIGIEIEIQEDVQEVVRIPVHARARITTKEIGEIINAIEVENDKSAIGVEITFTTIKRKKVEDPMIIVNQM